jgi:PAS domain S-box-containing protein
MKGHRSGQAGDGDDRGLVPRADERLETVNAVLRKKVHELRQAIIERKAMEQALRDSERLYRAIGETIDYGVWVCAPDGRNLYASESFLRLVGLTQEQCSNFGWGDVLHPDDAERTIAAWKECVRTGGAWDVEHRFRGLDGEWHPILARGVPVRNADGEITCWAGINLDIGRLKRTENALREADRAKSEFLALLSHELRNPLAPIRNSLYILERAPRDGEQAQLALATIERQFKLLTRLVDDLLEATRISRNAIRLRRQRLELGDLVRRAVDDHRFLFESEGKTVTLEPAPELLFLDADWDRLSQIVGNLLLNAAKFSGPGGATSVSVARDPDGGCASVRVVDDGIGIAPDIIERLFQPFTQADTTLDRGKGGLGLGLALVKGLVELHGGTVTARSDGAGRGAEFTLHLPLVPAEAAAPPPPATRAESPGRRVLIIEDNPDAATSLATLLEITGHEVSAALDGADGIAVARRFRPDVVLCDIGLPKMDGYEVARTLRADEAFRGTVLVALTGYALPDDAERAVRAGFDRHMAKPVKMEELEDLLLNLG